MAVKIAIAGIGAVGGYFGGLLADHFHGSSSTQIFFIARGENEKVIRKNGLRLKTPNFDKTVFPHLTTSDPSHIGPVDFLICSCKSFDLADMMTGLKPCIGKHTVILPLLNGVDSHDILTKLYPENEIWKGCVYLVSRLKEPGLVNETGNVHSLFFGSEPGTRYKLELFLKLTTEAGINAKLSENIEQTVWEKFVFISSIATLTSYLDKTIGEIFENESYVDLLKKLLSEILAVAKAKNVPLPEDILDKTVRKMSALPYETTSSMHSDYQKGKFTEVHSLTLYVIEEGRKLSVPTPAYETMFNKLKTLKE